MKQLARCGDWLCKDELVNMLTKEVAEFNRRRSRYRPIEHVGYIAIVEEPFSVENGLLGSTLKVRRAKVVAKYDEVIEELFHHGQK